MSSIAIAAEDPVDEENPRNFYLGKADYIFTLTFAFEVCLKVGTIQDEITVVQPFPPIFRSSTGVLFYTQARTWGIIGMWWT